MSRYRTDPIFKNFGSREFMFQLSEKINHSLGNKSFVETYWIDGIDYNKLEKFKQNQTVLITNNIIESVDYQQNIHTVNESFYGFMYCPYDIDLPTLPDRDFNCCVNRFDIFRQSWFYHLVRRNWLDRGYISFNCDITHSMPDASYAGLTAKEIFQKGFQEVNQIFSAEHEKIKDQIPFQNFFDNGDLTNIILSSKFSLVLETWFHDNRVITFSEKIMRCLQLPRPWVLFTTRYGVQQLRTWGFDVLDDLVDHSYDTIADPIQRQLSILSVSEKLMNIDIEQSWLRCQQASKHNQNILKNWADNWADNISNDFRLAEEKARALQMLF